MLRDEKTRHIQMNQPTRRTRRIYFSMQPLDLRQSRAVWALLVPLYLCRHYYSYYYAMHHGSWPFVLFLRYILSNTPNSLEVLCNSREVFTSLEKKNVFRICVCLNDVNWSDRPI